MTAFRPASGTRLFYLDDEGILFSEPRQELHHFNTAATLVWSLLEEGATEAQAASELATLCTLDAATGTRYVSEAIAQWRGAYLLEGPAPPVASRRAADPPDAGAHGPWSALADFVPVVECRYELLETTFRVRFASEAQWRVVHPVLGHLATEGSRERSVAIDVVAHDGRLVIFRDGARAGSCDELREVAPLVKSLVWQSAVNGFDYFLDIHAGVVGDERACMLLPGAPGSGKSTLTAALVRAGFVYYSDEIALLAHATLDVRPAPLALCVKSTGRAAVEALFPAVRDLPSHRRMDDKEVAYFVLPAELRARGDHPRPVTGIVFPRYAQDAAPALVPLSKAVALKRLLDECVVLPKRLDASDVESLVSWIGRIPCHALTYRSSDQAVAAVMAAFPSEAFTRRPSAPVGSPGGETATP